MAGQQPTSGRRERKRDATRTALINAALRLFDEQGYDATSVEQIADAVDVSARTFHRYFPNKEDVLFVGSRESKVLFAEALAKRPRNEHVFISLREAAANFATREDGEYDLDLRYRIVASHERLHAISLLTAEEWIEVAAEFAADRLDMSPGDRLPRVLARCAIAAMVTAREHLRGRPASDDIEEIRACFDVLADLTKATGGSRALTTRRQRAS